VELSSEDCIAPSAVYQPPSTPPSTASSYPAEPAAVNKRRAIRRNLIEASSLTNSSTLLPYAPLRKSTRRKKISSNDCSTCGKTYKTERGLNSHGRQAHKSIPQFDGTSDELELPFIFESEFAKEDVLFTLEEVLTDEINVELISRTKVDDDIRSGDYVFSIRVSPPNMDWNWPVMNTIQREVLKNLRNGSSSCC